MKNQHDQADLISAYLDGEIHSAEDIAKVEHLIANDPKLRRESELLRSLKTSLSARSADLRTPVPVDLERNIRLSLGEEVLKRSVQESDPTFIQKIVSWLARPMVAIPSALVLAIAVTGIYMLLSRADAHFELSSASYANFEAVVRGDIKLVRVTSDTAELQRFFREQGVTYTVFYPQIDAELKGGVVSQHGDKKFAHLVYGSGAHLVYLFEVDVPSIESGTVTLAEEIAKDVQESRWHWEEKDNVGTLFVWKSNTVMCSAVSDMNTQEFSALFRLETL